jgi:hypothetical protein
MLVASVAWRTLSWSNADVELVEQQRPREIALGELAPDVAETLQADLVEIDRRCGPLHRAMLHHLSDRDPRLGHGNPSLKPF